LSVPNVQYSLSQDPLTEQGSYGVLNGNVGMSMNDGRYQVTLFVDNILDKNHATNIFQDFVTGVSVNTLQFRPKDAERVFGIALRGSF
jgi:iron complex outermembrane receptor protein